MPVQDVDDPRLAPGNAFQLSEEVDFLAREELLAEAARLPECRAFADDERAGRPLAEAAQRVPHPDRERRSGRGTVVRHGAAAGEAAAARNQVAGFKEQLLRRKGICV